MKIVTVVGIRGSGKTTVIEGLVRELTSRGLKVGTVKTVSCPGFHMDKPGSNTDRHARAGASPVAARAEEETTVLYPRRLKASEILCHYRDCDWVLVEGDYELPVTRVVAAHGDKDALERINPLTAAVSGRAAGETDRIGGLPAYPIETKAKALADLLLRTVPETEDLLPLDEGLNGPDLALSRGFHDRGEKENARKGTCVTVAVGGIPLRLSPEQEKTVLGWAGKE